MNRNEEAINLAELIILNGDQESIARLEAAIREAEKQLTKGNS